MIKLERISKVKLPPFYSMDKKTVEQFGEAISNGIIDGIKRGKQADGTNIKQNAPSTKQRKRELGRGFGGTTKSLIDIMHRFIQPGKHGTFSVNTEYMGVSVELNGSDLNDISISLQKRGYTGWFGVYAKARTVMKKILREHIKKSFGK